MKIHSSNNVGQQGTVLLVCMAVAAVIGVTLASYLLMTQNQNASIYRSQTWNNSIAVTEAGVEDGLQMVNELAGTLDITRWTNFTATENWTNIAPNVYYVHRILDPNSYDVYITNLNNMPVVTAYSTLGWTFQYTTAAAQSPAMFAATTAGTTSSSIGRRITVATTPDPLLNVAMAAVQTIDLKGNDVATDSFDSGDTNYCGANGVYPVGQLNKTKANGDVCTDGIIQDSLSVGNANIKGHVKTGPGVNTMSWGPNSSVGDRAWVEAPTSGIKPGWSATDFNVAFPDVILPSAVWWPAPGSGSVGGVSYATVLNQSFNDYSIVSLSGGVYVPTNKNVRLKITSSASLNGNDVITICPGGSLTIYMQGSSFTMGGSSYVDNQTHHAQNFCVYGLPTCTNISLSGNGEMDACVYAPSADYTLNGGGSSAVDFVGSSVTKTAKLNGHFNFHYDENLRRVGPMRGYIPISWGEVANH